MLNNTHMAKNPLDNFDLVRYINFWSRERGFIENQPRMTFILCMNPNETLEEM